MSSSSGILFHRSKLILKAKRATKQLEMYACIFPLGSSVLPFHMLSTQRQPQEPLPHNGVMYGGEACAYELPSNPIGLVYLHHVALIIIKQL